VLLNKEADKTLSHSPLVHLDKGWKVM